MQDATGERFGEIHLAICQKYLSIRTKGTTRSGHTVLSLASPHYPTLMESKKAEENKRRSSWMSWRHDTCMKPWAHHLLKEAANGRRDIIITHAHTAQSSIPVLLLLLLHICCWWWALSPYNKSTTLSLSSSNQITHTHTFSLTWETLGIGTFSLLC